MIHQFDKMGDGYERSLREYPHIRQEERQDLLETAGLGPGMAVLDYAAGSGFLTLDMARIIGSDGRATAVDTSKVMLAYLQEKAARSNCHNIRSLACEDSQTLPLHGSPFDRIVCLGGFHHVSEQARVTKHLFDQTRSGGRVVIMDFEDDTPIQRHFDYLVHEHNPTGHVGWFLSQSRAINFARFSGCKTFTVEKRVYRWRFKDTLDMGRFFAMHHGLDLTDEETARIAAENFVPEILPSGEAQILINHILLCLVR